MSSSYLYIGRDSSGALVANDRAHELESYTAIPVPDMTGPDGYPLSQVGTVLESLESFGIPTAVREPHSVDTCTFCNA